MALKLKYQGREQSRSRDEATYRETWYGTESEVDAQIALLTIGDYTSGKGYLHGWEKTQENAAVWDLSVSWRVTYARVGDDSEDEEPESGSTAQHTYSLSVRNVQMPIEGHPSYRACWSHYLLGKGATLPAWWSTATDTLLSPSDRAYYMWVSSIGEIPQEPDGSGNYWTILAQPTKPGVQVYDEACFVVTERSRHKHSADAGRAISTGINKVFDPAHTFGITGGEWKLDEASVEHDGRRWVATCRWTRALSWDNDIYDHPQLETT